MDEGFVPDLAHMNQALTSKWTEGAPGALGWAGLNLKDKQRYAITTYRCPSCGLLQSYARAT